MEIQQCKKQCNIFGSNFYSSSSEEAKSSTSFKLIRGAMEKKEDVMFPAQPVASARCMWENGTEMLFPAPGQHFF